MQFYYVLSPKISLEFFMLNALMYRELISVHSTENTKSGNSDSIPVTILPSCSLMFSSNMNIQSFEIIS